MNSWSNTGTSDWSRAARQPPGGSRSTPYESGLRPRWRIIEIAVIVAGFMVWWAAGLALLLWKIWRNRQGYSTDMVTAARGAFEEHVMKRWPEMTRGWGGRSNGASASRDWRFTSFRSSGNSAFDEWRENELARLEEERRKLEAAEREFTDYIESLRRAKDREEFERFMRDRAGSADNRPNA
jgi:hypothetical protein